MALLRRASMALVLAASPVPPVLFLPAMAIIETIAQIREDLILAARQGWIYVVDVLPTILKYKAIQQMRNFVQNLSFLNVSLRIQIREWLVQNGW